MIQQPNSIRRETHVQRTSTCATDRAVLLTVTLIDADQIRVNIVPKKLKDGENDALTTPLSVTGTAEDLDADLSSTLVGFVGSHLQMKNTLEKVQGRDGCGLQDGSGRSTRKGRRHRPSQCHRMRKSAQPAPTAKRTETVKPAPQKPASLFDMPTPATILPSASRAGR